LKNGILTILKIKGIAIFNHPVKLYRASSYGEIDEDINCTYQPQNQYNRSQKTEVEPIQAAT
jgi:hypothetical protein